MVREDRDTPGRLDHDYCVTSIEEGLDGALHIELLGSYRKLKISGGAGDFGKDKNGITWQEGKLYRITISEVRE